METKQQTVKEWLEELSTDDTSTDKDSRMMESLLHKIGMIEARVVVGIVYLEGRGTIDHPPISIHTMAKLLLMKVR